MGELIISLCIPCMGRTHDLKETMPHLIKAVNESPPVEIMILNYNSKDDLNEFIKSVEGLKKENSLSYAKYYGREHYHLAHAWNLAVRASVGDYIVIMGTDAILARNYIERLRKLIKDGCIWMRTKHLKGIVAVKRKLFMEIGGYDERFEVYGGEDRDFEARLLRSGKKLGLVPNNMISIIKTSKKEKFKNYKPGIPRRKARELRDRILDRGQKHNILVVNNGKSWGQWKMGR